MDLIYEQNLLKNNDLSAIHSITETCKDSLRFGELESTQLKGIILLSKEKML